MKPYIRNQMLLLALMFMGAPLAPHAAGGVDVADQEWHFEGLVTQWDKDQLYRGYTVATQVCMACHSFKYVNHRHLIDAGFTPDEAKALAADLNLSVEDALMSGLDDVTAKELYGKAVPDLSLMNKARAGLADYTFALLTGYVAEDSPAGQAEIAKHFPEGVPAGAYYNRYYPGHAIAMPNPLSSADLVTYHDGTVATIDQMARDVTYFMQWTAEPELLERKTLGVYVLLYVIIFIGLTYLTKTAIWRDVT